jgi:type I restriction enzyme M protein
MRGIEAANQKHRHGVFGDSQWTNKDRLPAATLKNLLEHFSRHTLSIANVPEDELGNGYEFLIRKFADDRGHTAQEFYTNRTVAHLMLQMLEPRPGEKIYDPTCGTGGRLISALDEVKRKGGEYRTLNLYGRERNHMTASIARMNLALHGVDDFAIARGGTLERPAFTDKDRLAAFVVVLANPPYVIKQWNREAWTSDSWGRNLLGTPPQGRADQVFFQHILKSMDSKTGCCAILFPHGVLFRKEEADMRQKLVDADLVDCVLGLGANLFYNSPMEACVVICRNNKPAKRRGHVIFIDAVNEGTRARSMSYLKPEHRDGLRTRITLSRMWKVLRRWLHWQTFAPTMAI